MNHLLMVPAPRKYWQSLKEIIIPKVRYLLGSNLVTQYPGWWSVSTRRNASDSTQTWRMTYDTV
jgi:hypothetical protein